MRARLCGFAALAVVPFLPLRTPTSQASACSVQVHVDGFRNSKGLIGGAVFKTPAGWPEMIRKLSPGTPFLSPKWWCSF